MISGSSQALRLRLSMLVLVACLALLGVAAPPALATHFTGPPTGSTPLDIWIGKDGWFQELVEGNENNSFFPPRGPQDTDTSADAGFVLAFPNVAGTQASDPIEGQVWGWAHDEAANDLDFHGHFFTPLSQGTWTGSGTEGNPFNLVTVYEVKPASTALVRVTQTTTYVNGEFDFVNAYAVENLTADPLKFRALIGADLYLNESDCGTGIFKSGPPQFIGGYSNGNVGGFTEPDAPAVPWTTYFEGQYGGSPGGCQQVPRATGVWDYLEGAYTGSGFPSSPAFVDPSFVDNGIGIQWDTRYSTALPAGQTQGFQLNTLGTVPGTLALTPASQSISAGSGVTLTATGTSSAGGAASGALVRFTVSGANVASGAATTNASGQAAFSYTPTNAGTDTVTAYEDIDGNGSRGSGEPTATATVAVAGPTAGGPGGGSGSDKTPPKITLLVSSKAKLKKFLKGLSIGARINESASPKIDLFGSPPPKKGKAGRRRSASCSAVSRSEWRAPACARRGSSPRRSASGSRRSSQCSFA